ncbi:MAG: hypothetical protein JNL69_05470 [Bacteroidia bacterium]|nr:hypothetical protein [Bacteroidia bacterium]
MIRKEQLIKLATERNTPCVTISLNTHRTHPDNAQDEVMLKNLLKEAEDRVIAEFGKKSITPLLEKIKHLNSEVDVNYNQNSLHLFLSNDTKEMIKSSWNTRAEGVQISDRFAVRPLIKLFNGSESYLLMVLSQGGVQLYEALNDEIIQEIRNDDFPFSENRHYNTHSDKGSDSKHLDDLVREFLNKVDKALIKVYNETNLNCVVVCTEDNHSRLQQVADKPTVYLGYSAIDYNKMETHQIVKQAWEIIKTQQKEHRNKAVEEIKESVAQGAVLTDLQEIFQAALDGRGDLLMIDPNFSQSVIMTSDRTFELSDDKTKPDTIEDITSNIAWEVLSKKGRVFFTADNEIKELGNIVLKTRY